MKLVQILKLILGSIALLFGLIGLFLPLWPTTPFILLALGCFSARPRVQAAILKIPMMREYYESYTDKKGLPMRTVITSLSVLWSMLALSMFLVQKLPITLILVTVGLAVTAHILWIARLRKGRVAVVEDDAHEA